MAFVDASARFNLATFGVAGAGSHLMGGTATVAASLGVSGSLQSPAYLIRARALSSTKLRVDFSEPIDPLSGVVRPEAWKIKAMQLGIAEPVVKEVRLPPVEPKTFVDLVISEMTNGGKYAIAVNYSDITDGPELVVDGDMEAAGTGAWAAVNGASLSKQPVGGFGGTGARMLQVTRNGDYGQAKQSILNTSMAYRFSGRLRGDGTNGASARSAGNWPDLTSGIIVDHGVSNVMVHHQDVLFQAEGNELILEKYNASFGQAHFDDISIKKISGSGLISGILAKDATGLAVTSEAQLFNGVGAPPNLLLALATSATTVEVHFDEALKQTSALLSPLTWTFNLGLSVVEVLSIAGGVVTLKTSEQTPGELYTLTIGSAVVDLAGNVATPPTTPMLGFTSKAEDAPAQKLNIYLFLTEQLRVEDQKATKLLERLLEGPQAAWLAINDAILSLPKLWSSSEAPAAALHHLKRIVGWTTELDVITANLDEATLRRLISASTPFWKSRGPEETIASILRLVTRKRVRILNWFDYRAILDEVHLGYEYDSNDPWVVEAPGGADPDPWTYNVRIVDDGDLDRVVVRNLCRLTRPAGERVDVTYLGFLDEFTIADDLSQWTVDAGTASVGGGTFTMSDALAEEAAHVSLEGATDWSAYTVGFRIRGTGTYACVFYWTGPDDYYMVRLSVDPANTIELVSVVGGVETVLFNIDISAATGGTITLDANVYHSFNITVLPSTPGSALNEITVMFDGNVLPTGTTDSSHVSGTLGVRHEVGGSVELDITEMIFVPGQSDYIDINDTIT